MASLDDGFYGRGMYFTSKLSYAAQFAKFSPLGKVFLIALTIPGNPFPTCEPPFDELNSLRGQACQAGYQSHYVQVTSTGHPAQSDKETLADELVLFEGSQTLPLFLVYTTEFGRSYADSIKPLPESPIKTWAFLKEPDHPATTKDLESLLYVPSNTEEDEEVEAPETFGELRVRQSSLHVKSTETQDNKKKVAQEKQVVRTKSASKKEIAQGWTSGEAANWLEDEGLAGLKDIAKTLDLDGAALYGLFESREDGSFAPNCNKLGIVSITMQLRLKGKLSTLFEKE